MQKIIQFIITEKEISSFLVATLYDVIQRRRKTKYDYTILGAVNTIADIIVTNRIEKK